MTDKKSFPFFSLFASGAACVLVLFPLRIYQYFKILEPETGFYSHHDFSVYLLYVIFAFAVLFSFIITVINKKSLKNKKINLSPITGAVVFGLAGIGFLADVAAKVTKFFDIYNGYSFNAGVSINEYLSQKGGTFLLLESVLALISATYFFSLAGGSASRKDIAPSLKIIALSAPLWSISRLLIRFKTTISFINVSDLFVELFAIVFTMLFLLYFAQTMSQVDKGATYWKMYAYGIPASVFSLTCFVPRLVVSVMGNGNLISNGYDIELCNLVIPVMIIATLISRSYSKKSN